MAQNPFSYEDAFPPEREAGASSQSSFGYEDAFPGAPPPKRSATDYARDVGATAVKGAIAVPEALVGLADIPTGGAVGKFLENEGGAVGFRPKQAKEAVNEWHSDATKEAQRKFQAAEGIGNKAIAAWDNPSVVATTIGESIPSMLTGGLAARGILAASKLGQMGVAGARIAGAVGEGVMGAGSAAEQIRQQTDDGLLSPGQMAAAAGTGLATAAFGALGGKVASKLGIGDVDTMIAQGSKGIADDAASAAARAASNPLVQQQAMKGIPRRVIEGAIAEGFLEELPQSVAEQVFQNVALGKDWLQDVDAAAVMGVLSGGVMGGAASGYHGMRQHQPSPQQQPLPPEGEQTQATADETVSPGMERLRQAYTDQLAALQQQEQGEPAVPQSTPPDGAAVLAQQQATEAAQRLAATEASRAVASPDDEIYQSTGAAIDPVREQVAAAAAQGGALSSAALTAIDTGAAGQAQQAAQQAAQEADKSGDNQKTLQKQERESNAKQGLDPETGEILSTGQQMAEWSDADLSNAFRGAQSREVRMQLAQELGRRRNQALQDELDAEQAGTVLGAERADTAFASLTEDAGQVPGDLSISTTTEGIRNGPQAVQTQQDRAQPPQVGAAPEVARGAPDAQGRAGAAGPQAAAGLTDAAPTSNPGAQAAAAPGAQAAPTAEDKAQRIARTGEAWTRMPSAERQGLAERADLKPIVRKNVHRAAWADLNSDVQRKLADAAEPEQQADTRAFAPETGTLGVPRDEMPQVPTRSHGGLVKHLNAQGIAHETTTVDAGTLKPTQAEYSPSKVEEAKAATGDRAVIVSSDGHIIDGHHQAMAAAEDGKPVKAIVLDAPVDQALEAVKNSPSAQAGPKAMPPAAAAPTAKKRVQRGILAKKAEAEEKARADYFTPGNIVKGYSGHDRVISYTPADERGNWAVKVQHVVQQGGEWVVDPADPRERTHATLPDAKALKAGPVARVQPAQGAADASVQDGQAAVEAPAQQPAEEASSATVSAQDFIPAPDGGLDYGEITPEMGKAMRRQAGKIRLQRGDASFGLVHIEQRHGEEIRKTGFDSVEEFVSGAVADIESIWRPEATSQLVVIQATERGKVVFIQLQAGKDEDGDFYTVKTAFPSSRTYAEKRKEWKQLWSRVPVPAADAGKSAPSAELGNETGSKSTMDSSQSDATSLTQASTAAQPSKPITDFGEKIGGTMFSQGLLSPNASGPKPTPEQVQRLVDKVQQVAKQAIPVTVAGSPSDVVGVEVPIGAKPSGALIDGRIYLFSDNLGSIGDAYVTLFHEIFHLGLQRVLPAEDYAAVLRQFARNPLVARYVTQWKGSPEGVQKAATMPSAAYEALANEEALAMVSEALSVDGIGTRPMPGLARRMLSWFADVAERLGLGSNFSNWVRGLTRTDAEKFVSDMTRAVLGGESNLARARAKYGTTAAELTGQNRLSAARDADEFAGVGQNAAPGFNVDSFLATMGRSAAVTKSVSATNRAIMDMAREGQTAQDILRLVAGTSKSRFNRQVARLLLRTGISPTVTLADADLGSGDGFKFLAKYSRKADAVTLTPGAAFQAEHIVLHELIHAATLRALDRKGLASLQMRRLFEHVRKQGGAAGQYGMKNVGEFVAEAFTNPEFQQVLRQMDAPVGGTLKSAWDGFVRILRSILGLPQDGHDALSRALELGVQVMREDKALRQRGVERRQAGDAFVQSPQTRTTYEGRIDTLFNGGKAQVGTAVLDRSDVMGLLGHPDVPLMLNERHLLDGLATHPEMTAEAWKKVPGWLENPAAVFTDPNHPGRMMVIAPERIAGYPVLMAVEPNAGNPARGKSGLVPSEQLLVTVFAKTTGELPALGYLGASGRLLYADTKKAPEVWRRAGVNPQAGLHSGSRAGDIPRAGGPTSGAKKILTEKHLNGWRKAQSDDDVAHFGAPDARALKDSALAQVEQALTHPGKVSVWDKTVGTMRNLAERSPAFKPVYESAQRFIDDVSTLANDAADQAPRLLPRVETLADLKKKPITAADNKAVAKPLFEGTLLWARDVDGTPVTTEALNDKYRNTIPETKAQILLQTGKIQAQMLRVWQELPVEQFNTIINNKFDSTILKPGVVWTAKELSELFGLTAQQVSLYQEARAAIDRSIDMTARADMLRALGEAYADLREPVLEQATLEDAMKLLTDALQAEARENPDGADRVLALNNAVVKSYERAKELQDAGYAPLSRFGRYTVDVVSQDGTREYFGMFETMREANQMAERMRGEFKGANVTQGTMSDEAYKLFQGITPESLEQFGHMLGLDEAGENAKDKAFQAYLQLAKNNHSALKRLIHRKGISGYSEDVGRVLASFVYSNARLAAGGLNAGTLESAIEAIPKEQGELKDVAMGLRSYIQDPQEEGQAVRGMLFAQYLGGSVASAMVNMTQPFQITMPWLSQFGGMRKAAAQMARAVRDVGTRDFKGEPDLTLALQHAVEDGTVAPQEIHQLMAQARGTGSLRTGDGTRMGDARAAAANHWERVKVAWGQPFALAEQFNRRSTFIAAYRMAKEQGMDAPAEFARRAVLETQFVYSKANKPQWARGTIGGTLFTFKTYSVSYLELMQRMWTQGGPDGKRAVGWAVAMLLLMGGAGGLPFMEDAEDLIDGAGQLMGYNVSAKHWRKQALRDILGKELADFVDQGVSGLPGAPVDVSGRLGMGNLIPGTGLLLSKPNRERDLLEIAGPAGDLVARGFTGARKALTGDVAGAALEVSPTAVRNAAKGIDMATSGIYKDTKGYKVIDTTLDESIAKAIGFQPRSVAEVQQSNAFMLRSKSFYTQTSSDIKAQWAQALFNKDDAALERVRERLADWNRDNPDQPIAVKMPDVWKRVREMGKDRTQRIADTAPKALRLQMREMARENG